jgi:hypothetical protein
MPARVGSRQSDFLVTGAADHVASGDVVVISSILRCLVGTWLVNPRHRQSLSNVRNPSWRYGAQSRSSGAKIGYMARRYGNSRRRTEIAVRRNLVHATQLF